MTVRPSELGNRMWKMDLNETLITSDRYWIITRVPVGWIYARDEEKGAAVFVPLSGEFVGSFGG